MKFAVNSVVSYVLIVSIVTIITLVTIVSIIPIPLFSSIVYLYSRTIVRHSSTDTP
jgi:hypothetical protein